jgi:hypothetical protein
VHEFSLWQPVGVNEIMEFESLPGKVLAPRSAAGMTGGDLR